MDQEKKKTGRPSQGKVWKSFTLDKEIADFLDSLPDGERSKVVNNLLARGIAEYKAIVPKLKGDGIPDMPKRRPPDIPKMRTE